jgi:hypothetical protein
MTAAHAMRLTAYATRRVRNGRGDKGQFAARRVAVTKGRERTLPKPCSSRPNRHLLSRQAHPRRPQEVIDLARSVHSPASEPCNRPIGQVAHRNLLTRCHPAGSGQPPATPPSSTRRHLRSCERQIRNTARHSHLSVTHPADGEIHPCQSSAQAYFGAHSACLAYAQRLRYSSPDQIP